ncbi:hypothetical protein D9756_010440 [Leucocoprinus leucothites]|uniref:NADP-dependent oxidoreductase domain-containing protein n=1 Tax=Leucocoprinus leucothites TaxID=201217 RepID=A0A8H5CRW9_9AGAR|nr:hypothetical protein D9756_010440 [Leucoagaricus leucothites]
MANSPKKIPYVRLGNSGLKVSRFILGTMQYGDKRWQPWVLDDQAEVTRHVKAAYDAGIQTFDTADVYSNGVSEILLGNAIKELKLPREEIVVMTKLYETIVTDFSTNFMITGENPDEHGYVNQHGLSRKWPEYEFLDYIDLLQCHRFDQDTPIEETMQALHDVVKAGYVRYIGMSSCYAWQFSIMQNYALTHHLTPFISMQNHYNLVYREEEREMIPTLKHFGVGMLPWSPIAKGLLTRPLTEKTTRGSTDWAITKYLEGLGTEQIIKRVEEVSKKRGITMAQVAVAWVLTKDPTACPVVGTTSLKNLDDLLGAVNVVLTPEEMKYLEEPYRPQGIVGHA